MAEALITGRSRRLGRALARGLAGAGWSLVLDARGADALRATRPEIDDADPSLVDLAFERRRQARAERAGARLGGLGLDDRARELAAALDDDGYLASCERLGPGRWEVVEHNCAILDVARQFGTELSFLRETVPDAEVVRTAHMTAGCPRLCLLDHRAHLARGPPWRHRWRAPGQAGSG